MNSNNQINQNQIQNYKTNFTNNNNILKNQINKNKSKQKINNNNNNNNNNNSNIINNNNHKPEKQENLNNSNIKDFTKFFKEGNLTKKDLTHFSILSPKTQKEILNNQANLIMMNENLFQKKIDFCSNSNGNHKEDYICKKILLFFLIKYFFSWFNIKKFF